MGVSTVLFHTLTSRSSRSDARTSTAHTRPRVKVELEWSRIEQRDSAGNTRDRAAYYSMRLCTISRFSSYTFFFSLRFYVWVGCIRILIPSLLM